MLAFSVTVFYPEYFSTIFPLTNAHSDYRLHPGHMFMDRSAAEASTSGSDKRKIHPPMEAAMGAPLPKKGRYQEAGRLAPGAVPMSWSQPLRIDTSLDANKMKVGLCEN